MHGDSVYVRVDDRSILVRACAGRKDYVGGPNHYAPRDCTPALLPARCLLVARADEALAPSYSAASSVSVDLPHQLGGGL